MTSADKIRAYLRACEASSRAADARARLPAGASRARVTTANARWSCAAEERDRLARGLDPATLAALRRELGEPAPSIYHHLTEWIALGGESYRYAIPPLDALVRGVRQLDIICRVTPLGWTVWALDRSRIVEMGPELGEAGRILADDAARRVRWVLP